jgi:hypothetical protein
MCYHGFEETTQKLRRLATPRGTISLTSTDGSLDSLRFSFTLDGLKDSKVRIGDPLPQKERTIMLFVEFVQWLVIARNERVVLICLDFYIPYPLVLRLW